MQRKGPRPEGFWGLSSSVCMSGTLVSGWKATCLQLTLILVKLTKFWYLVWVAVGGK